MENYTPKPSVSFQPVGRIFAWYQALRTRLASLAQFFMPFHSNFCHFFPTCIRVWYQARQKGNRSSQEFDPQMSCRYKVIRDFKIQWRDGNENVLSLYLNNYSYPFSLSILDEHSWSWIPRDHIQVQKEKKISSLLVYILHKMRN